MRSITLFSLLLIAGSAFSQLIEFSEQRTESISFDKVLAVPGDKWLVCGTSSYETSFGGISYFIQVVDGSGQVVWDQPVPFSIEDGSQFGGNMVVLPDSGVFVAGYVDGCDAPTGLMMMGRYDPTGNEIWSQYLPFETSPIQHIASGVTDRIAVASADSMFIYDLNGDLLQEWGITGIPIKMHWAGDTALYMLTNDSLYLMDIGGSMISTTEFGGPGLDLHITQDHVWVLSDSSFFRSDLYLTDTISFPWNEPSVPRAFVNGDDGLYIRTDSTFHGINVQNGPYFMFDLDLLPAHIIRGAAVRNGVLMTAGRTTIATRNSGILRSYDMDGNTTVKDDDLEVLLVTDSTWMEFVLSGLYRWHADLSVHVVNHGTSDLEQVVVTVRHPIPNTFACGYTAVSVFAEVLALAPGDTTLISFPTLSFGPGSSYPGSTSVFNICVVGLSPNHHVDRNPADNVSCYEVPFVNSVGVAEESDLFSLKVYPVPFNETINLEWKGRSTLFTVNLMDMTGRIVHTESNISGNAGGVILEVQHLSNGTYMLMVNSEKDSFVERVVKQY